MNERIGWALTAVGAPLALPAGALVGIAREWVAWPLATTPYTAAGLVAGLGAIGLGAVGLAWLAVPRRRRAAGRAGSRLTSTSAYPLRDRVAAGMNGKTEVFSPGVIRFDFPTATVPVVRASTGTVGAHVAGRDVGLPPVSVGANHTTVLGGGVWEVPTAVPQSSVGTLTSRPQPTPPGGAAGAGTHASPRVGAVAAGGSPSWAAAGRLSLPQMDGPRRAVTRRGPDGNA